MPGDRHCHRIDTVELKLHIERRLGRQKAEKYFSLLSRYLSLKLNKSEFDRLCIGLLGSENVTLHNGLIRAIISNAYSAKNPPPKHGKGEDTSLNVKVPNGCQRSTLRSLCRDVFPQSPRKGRTPTLRDRKAKDRPSLLGSHGKSNYVAGEDSLLKVQEQQSATELLSLGSKPPVEVTSVEDGEEVEQVGSPGVNRKSPLRAPFGVSLYTKGNRKLVCNGSSPFVEIGTCYSNGVLPNFSSLRKRLERKVRMEGLNISTDCVNLLNNGMDAFMKRLLKPCLNLATSRSENKLLDEVQHQIKNGLNSMTHVQKSNRLFTLSMTDFVVAMEWDPRNLGEDWPILLQKISLHASQD